MKQHIEIMKARIKGQTKEARSLRQEARKSLNEARRLEAEDENAKTRELRRKFHDLRDEANRGRESRRILHLAYCYLRGRTYHQCEKTCHEKPSAKAIAKHAYVSGVTPTQEKLTDSLQFWLDAGDITRLEAELYGSANKELKDASAQVKRLQTTIDNEQKNIEMKERGIESDKKRLEKTEAQLTEAKVKLRGIEADLKRKRDEVTGWAGPVVEAKEVSNG